MPSVCVLYFNLSPTWEEKALVFCVRTDMTVMYILFLRYPYKYCHIWLCLSWHAKGAWSLLGISDHWDATLYSSASIPSWTPFRLPTKKCFQIQIAPWHAIYPDNNHSPLFSPADVSLKIEKSGWGEKEREERGWWTLYCICVSY